MSFLKKLVSIFKNSKNSSSIRNDEYIKIEPNDNSFEKEAAKNQDNIYQSNNTTTFKTDNKSIGNEHFDSDINRVEYTIKFDNDYVLNADRNNITLISIISKPSLISYINSSLINIGNVHKYNNLTDDNGSDNIKITNTNIDKEEYNIKLNNYTLKGNKKNIALTSTYITHFSYRNFDGIFININNIRKYDYSTMDNKSNNINAIDNNGIDQVVYDIEFSNGYTLIGDKSSISLIRTSSESPLAIYLNDLVVNATSIIKYNYQVVDDSQIKDNKINEDVDKNDDIKESSSEEEHTLTNEHLRNSIYNFLENHNDEFNVLDIANEMNLNNNDEKNIRKIKMVIRELLFTDKVVTVGRQTYLSKMTKVKENSEVKESKEDTEELKNIIKSDATSKVDKKASIKFGKYSLKYHNSTKLINYFGNDNMLVYSDKGSLIIWNCFLKYEKKEVIIPDDNNDKLDTDFDDFDDLDNLLTSDLFDTYFNEAEEVVDFKNNDKYIAMLDEDSDTAINNLVKANSKLVWKIVKKYRLFTTNSYSLDDMFIEGELGLMKAIKKFDPSRGHQFSTYAVWWIRQGITRGIPDQSLPIRIPVHMYESLRKLVNVNSKLYKDLLRTPLNEEISAEMNIPLDKILELKKINKKFGKNIVSLDKPLTNNDDGGESTLELFIENNDDDIDKQIDDMDLKTQVHKMLSSLGDREYKILCLRYGIGSDNPHTLQEIGDLFGVSRERIRQIEAKALKRIKNGNLKRYVEEWNS